MNVRRMRMLVAMRVKPEQHQHEKQTIMARFELMHGSLVGQQVAKRRFAEGLERDSRFDAN